MLAKKGMEDISFKNSAKPLLENEISTSSTYRELLAVKYILQAFDQILKSQCVQSYWDNENVSRIISGGSSKNHLQALAIDIYHICIINSIVLLPTCRSHFKRGRHRQLGDRRGNFRIKFGSFKVDRFADNKNKKVDCFNSKYHFPGTSAVNCFTCNWELTFNWLCPPIYLIGKTIRYLELCKGKGVPLVPIWKSAYFWPMFTQDGNNFRPFIKNFLLLDSFFISHARLSNSVFDGFDKFYSIALLLDFS